MRIRIVTVGRLRREAHVTLVDDYLRRVRRLGVTVELATVPAIRAGTRYSKDHVREREGRALLAALPERGTVVALDRTGDPLSSERLAARIEKWASPVATFVVGGPLGLDPAMRDRADVVLSLGPMTLPHELALVVLAEQIYRAFTIRTGLPYHK